MLLLDFIVTVESNSLSKNPKDTQPLLSRIRRWHHGNARSILIRFHVSPFVSCRMLLWFYFNLASPRSSVCLCCLKQTDSQVAMKWMFLPSPRERLFTLCIFSHFVQTGNWLCWENRATTNKTKLWMPCLLTMGLTVLCSGGTNCNDAFWKPSPFNQWIIWSASVINAARPWPKWTFWSLCQWLLN